MNKTAKTALIAVLCLTSVAFAVYMITPPKSGYERGVEHRRPHVCEACGCRFMELPAEGTLVCPKCGGQAVRAQFLVCGKCGAEFEAYRTKTHYVPVPPTGSGEPLLGAYYKRPDGDWVRSLEALGQTRCPKCGNADVGTMTEKQYSGADARAPMNP